MTLYLFNFGSYFSISFFQPALKGLVDYDYEEDEDEEDLGDDSQLSKDKNVNKNSTDNDKNISVKNDNQDFPKEQTQIAKEEVTRDKDEESGSSHEGCITNSVTNSFESEILKSESIKTDHGKIDEEKPVKISEPTFKTTLANTACDENNSVSTTSESSLICENIIEDKNIQNTNVITTTALENENKTEMEVPDSCTNVNSCLPLDNTSLVKTIDICRNSTSVDENESVNNEKINASLKRQSLQDLDVDSKKAKLHL